MVRLRHSLPGLCPSVHALPFRHEPRFYTRDRLCQLHPLPLTIIQQALPTVLHQAPGVQMTTVGPNQTWGQQDGEGVSAWGNLERGDGTVYERRSHGPVGTLRHRPKVQKMRWTLCRIGAGKEGQDVGEGTRTTSLVGFLKGRPRRGMNAGRARDAAWDPVELLLFQNAEPAQGRDFLFTQFRFFC